MIACGGIFPAEEIKAGQQWQGSSGHTVTVDRVNDHSVYYSWVERGTTMTHDKAHFAFQCRYCLILPNDERVHHYQRRRASITGMRFKLREIIEKGRLVGVG